MLNPFKYGEIVSGEDFLDREEECRNIFRDLGNGLKCFLISPRRYGKTSLIKKVIERLKRKGFLVSYVDLYGVASLEQMAVSLARACALSQETNLERIWKVIKDVIPRLRPVFTVEPNGGFAITVDVKERREEIYNTLMRLYNLPYEVSKKMKKPYIVIYDEFQEILNLGGTVMEKQIRSAVQAQSGIGYLFSGSKKSLMLEMTTLRERAFYKMGPLHFLGKMPSYYWYGFLKKRFQRASLKLNSEVINLIIEKAENVPYYVQYLAHEVWDLALSDKVVNARKVNEAIESICHKQGPLYAGWWDILTLPQKQLVQTISESGGRNIFSNDFLFRCKLNSAMVQKSVKLLLKKDILEKENGEYSFSDIWFKEWVKQVKG
ncbi:MAG: hypothetical protein COX46_05405 [bacterium (Candidatus Ratteibacteria) CG23_combo_of_CG06-09_8_20_14_all_48_7]|uniref:ATPase domain-containing protein n=1 Tax=bacterium (Candidatus Ratteibacteria) CG23_combo_of_CG06-09_8_20_14_all_48_7 TaxID=2014292 RepID=A0A2G9Y8W1_9BACT|nr:MAG: hypothetical protein COX46_05405 [bacterium (Candidatus Ratteibacteria) CG23_combo_of_CG06-09_8_20_14_all_48_7]